MQKDEDVGKMSQATPIVICESKLSTRLSLTGVPAKALELFLAVVVDESSKVTADRGAKRVEAYHLYVPLFPRGPALTPASKHAVNTIEMLDFLKEIVEPVADPSQGGTIPVEAKAKARAKGKPAEDESDEGEPKKRRVRRKKEKALGEEPKKRRATKKKAAAEAEPAAEPEAGEPAARDSEMEQDYDEDEGMGAASSKQEMTADEDEDEEGSVG